VKYNPDIHHRRSIRLKGYDYTQPGAYFITICTKNRECLFGEVVDGGMVLNDAGRMVQKTWYEIPRHYPGIDVDASVVMPNHIHGIVIIVGATPRGCPDTTPRGCPDTTPRGCPDGSVQAQGPIQGQAQGPIQGQAQGPAPTGGMGGLSLPDVVHRFKTLTTKRYVDGVKHQGWTPFPGKLWQRNYYEHIVRDENELNRIREYINNNPLNWAMDQDNPNVRTTDRSPQQQDESWRI